MSYTYTFEEKDKVCISKLSAPTRPMGYAVNHIMQWIMEHGQRHKETMDHGRKIEDIRDGTSAEKFRGEIWNHYKKAMEDCQVPFGPLASLNAAEYYAWCLKQKIEELEE